MNPSLNTEPSAAPKLVSFDSIRFNESMFEMQDKDTMDPVQKALESVRTEKTCEFNEFWDNTNGIYEQVISAPLHQKDIKGLLY